MADKKISALTGATTPLAGSEVLPIVQGGSTVKVAVSNLTAGRAVDVASLTASGNIAAGTTLNAWVDDNAIQLPQGAISSGYGYFLSVTSNAYRSSSNVWKYTTGQAPSQFIIGQSSFTWRLASTGTADSPISWTQVWSMDSTGNLTPAVAAKGVNFTANTPAAGMTSQLLNWYEEGTWTPTLTPGTSGSITLNTSFDTAAYTRVGRLVTITGEIIVTSVSSPVGATISLSLPIAIGVGVERSHQISGAISTGTFGTQTLSRYNGAANTSIIDITYNAASVTADFRVQFSISYFA